MSIAPRFHLHCTVRTVHSLHALEMMKMCRESLTKKMGSTEECEARLRANWLVYALDNVLHMEIYSETREQADPKNTRWDELAARAFQRVGNAPGIGFIVRRAPLDWVMRKIADLKLSTVEFEELSSTEK